MAPPAIKPIASAPVGSVPAGTTGPLGLASIFGDEHLERTLERFAAATAQLLHAERCSVMLVGEDHAWLALAPDAAAPASMRPASGRRLVVRAHVGSLPAGAFEETGTGPEGIADHVLETGCSLRVDDIASSAFASLARRAADQDKSFLCAPILMDARVVGVLTLSGRQGGTAFDDTDLTLLAATALTVGKSMQVSQLRTMLDSRFAQMAVARDAEGDLGRSLAAGLPNPDQVAKLMAKSFYKEMTRAGFGARQIINAASEIIAQLSGNLQRHNRRLQRVPARRGNSAGEDTPRRDDSERPAGTLSG